MRRFVRKTQRFMGGDIMAAMKELFTELMEMHIELCDLLDRYNEKLRIASGDDPEKSKEIHRTIIDMANKSQGT